MSIKDGGPAFPVADPSWLDPKTIDEGKRLASGMTLRDWFAGKALQGMAADLVTFEYEPEFAKNAYEMADAMLRAREEKSE